MINKIVIQGCATYDVECSIEPLNKINFIYGANGTGKTTISNFIKTPSLPNYSNCKITWQINPIDTLVYNKIFKDENFSTGKINGVFTLGKATKEDIELIETKTVIREKITEEGKKIKDTLEKQNAKLTLLENKFREELWSNLYKKNEKNFKEALRGFIGSKETFKQKILGVYLPTPQVTESIDNLLKNSKTLFSETPPTTIRDIQIINNDEVIRLENESVLSKVVVGQSDVEISKLIHKLHIDDWVNEGRNYISENICPFCQEKTITEKLTKQLESYFDKKYIQELDNLKQIKTSYLLESESITNLLEGIESSEKINVESKLKTDLFFANTKTLMQQFKANQNKLENKVDEPSRKIELEKTNELIKIINKLISDANIDIANHNNLVVNYDKEKEKLIKEIWFFLVEEYRNEISTYNKEHSGLSKGIKALEEQLKNKREEFQQIDGEIKILSQNVTDIQPTIDEINKLLHYYGFLNFNIMKASEEGFYQIQREDGDTAHNTLSEGEITFITFLYFLQLAKGAVNKENISNDRVLIIDDPISSLDSNILFVISTLVKNLINDIKDEKGIIKQIILLTHNVYFHKEVSFIDSRTDKSNKVHYWVLRKNGKTSSIQYYGMQNPIQSSYSLLWSEFKNENITSSVSIQNIMRRIIENYFKLLGKYGDDKLIERFESKEEREICKSLISWINDGSHSIHDDLFIEEPTLTVDTYKRVFKDIFLKTNHIAHYNMMMGIDITNNI